MVLKRNGLGLEEVVLVLAWSVLVLVANLVL